MKRAFIRPCINSCLLKLVSSDILSLLFKDRIIFIQIQAFQFNYDKCVIYICSSIEKLSSNSELKFMYLTWGEFQVSPGL